MREGIMLAKPYKEKTLRTWETVLVQPKLNGERCRVLINSEGVKLISSEGNEFKHLEHLNEGFSALKGTLEIDGELYIHEAPFEEIHSMVSRTVNPHPNRVNVQFHAFDLIDGSIQLERLKNLNTLIQLKNPSIKVVPTHIVHRLEDVKELLTYYRSLNYEGLLLKHPNAFYERKRSSWWLKWKPSSSDIYNCVGFKEEISIDGFPKGRLGALLCKGDDAEIFSVGSGLNDTLRTSLWEQFQAGVLQPSDLSITVSYQELTLRGVPRHPVLLNVRKKDEK